MGIEVAQTKEKLMRAALRIGARKFPGDVDAVLEAIVDLPKTEMLNSLPQECRDWLLQELTKHPPINSKDVLDDTIEYPVWIVWKLNKDIPIVVAICTSEKITERYLRLVAEEARFLGKPMPETFVEESRLNHLYGMSVTDLKSFKISSIMARNKKASK